MSFCRYCGKELTNAQCDCSEFQASMGNTSTNQNQKSNKKSKEPFLVQSFKYDFSSISGFMSSMRDQSGMSEPSSSMGDPYEHKVPIVPDCIEPEDGEVVVKQYNVTKMRTRLKFMKAEGRLMVTNKRVLFRAAGTSLTGNVLQEHQFDLNEIAGIEIHKDYQFSRLSFLGCILLNILAIMLTISMFVEIGNGGVIAIGVILGILGLIPTFIVYKRFWIKLFFAVMSSACFAMARAASFNGTGFLTALFIIANLVLLINLIIVCYGPNLVIKIKTKIATGAIVIGRERPSLLREMGDSYSGFAEVMPWEDTIAAINELGTMLDDLQTQGDGAIEKWSK